MRSMFRLALGAALVSGGLLAAPAAAQLAGGWSGPYVGGRLGYDFLTGGRNENVRFDTDLDGRFGDTVNTAAGANAFSPGFCGGAARGPTPADGCRGDRNGVSWGVLAGFDFQAPGSPLVVGAVVDFGGSDAKDRVTAFSTTPAFYTMQRRMKYTASARARAGYAFNSTLVYGTGGPAWARIKNRFTTSNTANAFSTSGNDSDWGYRVGGGIEQMLLPNVSVGVEYLYTSIRNGGYRVRASNSGTTPATNPFLLVNADGTDFRRGAKRFDTHSVGVTGNFRF